MMESAEGRQIQTGDRPAGRGAVLWRVGRMWISIRGFGVVVGRDGLQQGVDGILEGSAGDVLELVVPQQREDVRDKRHVGPPRLAGVLVISVGCLEGRQGAIGVLRVERTDEQRGKARPDATERPIRPSRVPYNSVTGLRRWLAWWNAARASCMYRGPRGLSAGAARANSIARVGYQGREVPVNVAGHAGAWISCSPWKPVTERRPISLPFDPQPDWPLRSCG